MLAPVRFGFSVLSQVAPRLASRIAIDIFCRPHSGHRRSNTETDLLRGGERFTIRASGLDLAAWSWGTGPVVLLHHGWGGTGSQLGAFVKPLVAAGYRVVAYDAPAHGDSSGRITNAFAIAGALAEVIRRLENVHGVVAHSIGCSATAFALREDIEINRVVFLNPPGEMEIYSHQFAKTLGFSAKVRDLMQKSFETNLNASWSEFLPENLTRDQTTGLLVISDSDDAQVPWKEGERIAELWPAGRFVLTSGLGHTRILADEKVIALVEQFLNDHRTGERG